MTFSYYVLAILAVGPCVQDRTAAFAPVTVGWTMVQPFNHLYWPLSVIEQKGEGPLQRIHDGSDRIGVLPD
jgi:hypothetical protein